MHARRSRLLAVFVGFVAIGVQIGFVTPASAAEIRGPFELHVPVLYYHRIQCYPAGLPAPSDYTCPDKFEAQLSALIRTGWTAITVDQLADLMKARRCPAARTLVVSFDDGAVDNYEVAAPILERLGMRGSFFVNPGIAGRMSFAQMRDLVARGHAIGNHGLSHVSLPGLTAAALDEQIEGAQQLLARELGYRPRTFAYPYGRFGKRDSSVVDAVRASRFQLAFTIVRGARESTARPLMSRRLRTKTVDDGTLAIALLEPFAASCAPYVL